MSGPNEKDETPPFRQPAVDTVEELDAKADTQQAVMPSDDDTAPPATDHTEPVPHVAQEPPQQPILIVGGGRVGRAVMRKFPTGVVLETDPTKIERLRNEFGPARVLLGSGTSLEHLERAGLARAVAVVAATQTDETNYKIAFVTRKHGIERVIARVEDPEQQHRFTAIGAEPISAPLTACINMITNTLSPERRSIGEGVIGEGAKTVGQRIVDLDLPLGTIIVSILRGDHLIAPQDDEHLQVGDVVTIMTEDQEDLQPTLQRITGRNLSLNPLDRLYVVLDGTRAFSTAYREAFVMAQYANAELFIIAPEDQEEVVREARRIAEQDGIPFRHVLYPKDQFRRDLITRIRREDQTEGHGGLQEGIFFECVVVQPHKTRFLDKVIGRTPYDGLMRTLDHPILIARNLKPYRSILMVIDNNQRASMNIAHTIDIALIYGSEITALVPETAAGEESYRLLRYLKRAGRIYGVRVEERFVKGNPTIEFIREVKSGDYDLIVMDWHARSIKRDIIRRVMDHGPKSTLVLP